MCKLTILEAVDVARILERCNQRRCNNLRHCGCCCQLKGSVKMPGKFSAEADSPSQVSQLADILNSCLAILDRLQLLQAAAHLSAAIELLPGQSALPIVEMEDIFELR